MSPTRICFLDDYQGAARELAPLDRLEGAEVTVLTEHLSGDALVGAVAGHDVLVAMRERTRFDRSLLERLGDLRLLCTTGPANAAIDLHAAADTGVTVCATEGRASGNTAELTWALILAVLRHLPTEAANVTAGRWQSTIGTDLAGATLGLLGLGRIGQRVAGVGAAFGMEVVAWSQNLTAEAATAAGARLVSRDELLATADVLSVHLVLSGRTRGLLGHADLRAMKPGAVLINTSRGPIVDEAALVAALREGRLAGAGLDVFDEEPLPADHPFRSLPTVVATPHVGYVTRATLAAWYEDVVEDIAAWRRGQPVRVLTAPR
jgi:phosphoglycerate dehydrogenase-like enzyme